MGTVKRVVGIFVLVFLLTVVITGTCTASGHNYAYTRHPRQLYYDGYIQIKPSVNDQGRHAARGWFTYNNGRDGKKTYYTSWSKSYKDTRIYSKSARYYDTLNPKAPKTTFKYGFNWVTHSKAVKGAWPL